MGGSPCVQPPVLNNAQPLPRFSSQLGTLDATTPSQLYQLPITTPLYRLSATLQVSQGDAEIEIVRDRNRNGQLDPGEILARSNAGVVPSETVSARQFLEPDTNYYLRVVAANLTAYPTTQYNVLWVGGSTGGTAETARPLGSLAANQTLSVQGQSELVPSYGDGNTDYFSFTIATPQLVTLSIDRFAVAAQLRNAQDQFLTTTAGGERGPSNQPTAKLLMPGTYYVRVDPQIPVAADYTISLTSQAVPPNAEWIRQVSPVSFRTANFFASTGTAVNVDRDGNIYLAGVLLGGPDNPFVRKYTPTGQEQWTTRLPSPPVRTVFAAADGLGNTTIVTETVDGTFAYQLDATGQTQWQRSLNDLGGTVTNVAVSATGEIVIIGDRTVTSNGQSITTGWVSKWSATGDRLWFQDIVTPVDHDRARFVQIDSEGNIVVGGELGPVNNAIGSTFLGSFIVKYSASGQSPIWLQSIPYLAPPLPPPVTTPPSTSTPSPTPPSFALTPPFPEALLTGRLTSLTLDRQGNVYASRAFGEVFKWNGTNGLPEWTTLVQIDRSIMLRAIVVGPEDQIYLTGSGISPLSTATTPRQALLWGSLSTQTGRVMIAPSLSVVDTSVYAITSDAEGNLYLAGTTNWPVDGIDFTPGSNAFVMKIG